MVGKEVEAEFEAMMMQFAPRVGGVKDLLELFFGFLARRTDFYCVIGKDQVGAKMGFKQGVAEQLVMSVFKSHEFKSLEEFGPVTQEKPVSERMKPPQEPQVKPKKSPQQPQVGQKKPTQQVTPKRQVESSSKDEIDSLLSNQLQLNEEGKQIPIAGNGGVTDRYFWNQSLEDLTIYYNLPEGTNTKDIECSINMTGLKIGLRGKGTLLEGTYPDPERVKASDSFWSFEKSTSTLILNMEKARPTWWPCIIKGEPEIDCTKVDSTRKVEEYDETTQAQIRKIMFDQRQKAQGLPTSDDIIREEILEKAKNLPGSPFLQEK